MHVLSSPTDVDVVELDINRRLHSRGEDVKSHLLDRTGSEIDRSDLVRRLTPSRGEVAELRSGSLQSQASRLVLRGHVVSRAFRLAAGGRLKPDAVSLTGVFIVRPGHRRLAIRALDVDGDVGPFLLRAGKRPDGVVHADVEVTLQPEPAVQADQRPHPWCGGNDQAQRPLREVGLGGRHIQVAHGPAGPVVIAIRERLADFRGSVRASLLGQCGRTGCAENRGDERGGDSADGSDGRSRPSAIPVRGHVSPWSTPVSQFRPRRSFPEPSRRPAQSSP